MREWLIRWWMDVAMGGMIAFLGLGYRWMRKKLRGAVAENDALKAGIKALLRDRLVQAYSHYVVKGCWSIYSRDAVLDMYRQYSALGGNGTVAHLVDILEELPTEIRKDDIS